MIILLVNFRFKTITNHFNTLKTYFYSTYERLKITRKINIKQNYKNAIYRR